MQTESSANYYYRYKVRSADDFSAATLDRRKIKMKHNHATSILFDWTEYRIAVDHNTIELLNTYYTSGFLISHLFNFEQFAKMTNYFLESCFGNGKNPVRFHLQIADADQLLKVDQALKQKNFTALISLHLAPLTQDDLRSFIQIPGVITFNYYDQYFWHFRTYNDKLKRSLTVFDIGHFLKKNTELGVLNIFKNGAIKGLEIWNDQIPHHYELESEAEHCEHWHFETKKKNIFLSVIIPSFNNCKFLANVLLHLSRQDFNPENYEIIVVEDGGLDRSSQTIRLLFDSMKSNLNLKFVYWPKNHPIKGEQSFFRAGLARNLGARYSEGERLVFLDSDILVPKSFLSTCWQELQANDLIQFQRYHIQQQLSHVNPAYHQVNMNQDTYIEETHYWSQLFNCNDWHQLESHWKYTCTYALGINKSDFLKFGRFKKYYVSYGFEDTDLGFEMYRRNKKFKLVKLPLLHLTSYDQMQYKNSSLRRTQLLKKTAAHFYLQHLDVEIFQVLGNYFRFQKSLLKIIKDLL